MSGFDLNQQEIDNRTARMPARTGLEPGAFDNFLAGTGKVTMQTLAKAGSAIDLLGAVGPIVQDKFTGGTEAQDRYFQEHEEVFGNAVDYWTPKPNEVGAAGQVVGQLLGTLPLVFASPGLAVGATQVSTAEDLTKKGVDPLKAQAVGAVQAAGLGLGIWVPILGKTLAQRVLLGGAGFNAVQGVATRGASGVILEGTPGAEDFKAFDPTSLTLDVLLGAAFGGIAHVSPAMRAEGAAWQSKLADWGAKLKPSEIDALITMRQAQHINADSMPGKPVDMADADAHVQRLRQAIDDLANDRPISVEQMPPARYEIDPARQAEAEAEAAKVQADVAEVLRAEVEPKVGDNATAANDPAAVKESLTLEPVAAPAARAADRAGDIDAGGQLDPLAAEAQRFAAENPDVSMVIGKTADGEDITTTPRQMMEESGLAVEQARADATLFEVAASCLLGAK